MQAKAMPHFDSDEEMERFVESANLGEYDLTGFVPMHFELRRKDARINMRVAATQLSAVKQEAAREGIPYQRFIRNAIDNALRAAAKQQKGP
jgi:predicted DNA binding CopG/RHH family protein